MPPVSPPQSVEELLARSRASAGCTLGTLAARHRHVPPANLRRAKGWTGQLLEQVLGADAASLAEPDFRQLGIELKTLPVNSDGRPRESTYVCMVPLQGDAGEGWRDSWVCRKLSHVLWLPFESDPVIPPAQRRVGTALLWQPSPDQERVLRQDWEEIMDLVLLGRVDELSATQGTYLQVRPKAANHRALRATSDADGNIVQTLPRGFYLRTAFTAEILDRHYAANQG